MEIVHFKDGKNLYSKNLEVLYQDLITDEIRYNDFILNDLQYHISSMLEDGIDYIKENKQAILGLSNTLTNEIYDELLEDMQERLKNGKSFNLKTYMQTIYESDEININTNVQTGEQLLDKHAELLLDNMLSNAVKLNCDTNIEYFLDVAQINPNNPINQRISKVLTKYTEDSYDRSSNLERNVDLLNLSLAHLFEINGGIDVRTGEKKNGLEIGEIQVRIEPDGSPKLTYQNGSQSVDYVFTKDKYDLKGFIKTGEPDIKIIENQIKHDMVDFICNVVMINEMKKVKELESILNKSDNNHDFSPMKSYEFANIFDIQAQFVEKYGIEVIKNKIAEYMVENSELYIEKYANLSENEQEHMSHNAVINASKKTNEPITIENPIYQYELMREFTSHVFNNCYEHKQFTLNSYGNSPILHFNDLQDCYNETVREEICLNSPIQDESIKKIINSIDNFLTNSPIYNPELNVEYKNHQYFRP